jgi:ribulose-phosphate 3-epimerase
LSANFATLGQEVENVLASGADVVHFDVMDNHFVPNLTVGPLACKALRDFGISADIDVHLMVSPVDSMVVDFAKAGATYITFHPEASPHVDRTLQVKTIGSRQSSSSSSRSSSSSMPFPGTFHPFLLFAKQGPFSSQ